jgi:hypothetical protein
MNEQTNHAVSVWVGGRERKLYQLKPGGPFYVRFNVRGRDIERSTGSTIKAAAKHKAKDIVETELRRRSISCTWQQLCARVSALEKIVLQEGGAK